MAGEMILAIEPTVQAALVSSFGVVIVALLGLLAEGMRRNHNALRAVKKDTRSTKEQVENSHSTNLRDDIDMLIEKIEKVADIALRLDAGQKSLEAGQQNLTVRVNQLRDDQHASRVDQAQERQERLAADERIDRHIATVAVTAAQVHDALQRREGRIDERAVGIREKVVDREHDVDDRADDAMDTLTGKPLRNHNR